MKYEYLHVLEAVNVVLGWQPRENVYSQYVLDLANTLQNSARFDGTMDCAFTLLACLRQGENE